MAKETNLISGLSTEQLAIIAQAISSASGGGSDAINKMVENINRRMNKQEAEEEENLRIAMEQRKQGAINWAKKVKDEEAKQESCAHIKPNRQTAICGQRDHGHNTHYFCMLCNKHFLGQELPNWLAPDPMIIGGPVL